MSWMIFRPTYLVPTVSPKSCLLFCGASEACLALAERSGQRVMIIESPLPVPWQKRTFGKGEMISGGIRRFIQIFTMAFQPTCGKSGFVEEVFAKQMHETIHVWFYNMFLFLIQILPVDSRISFTSRAGNGAWIFMACSATSHFHQWQFDVFVESCWKNERVWWWQLA